MDQELDRELYAGVVALLRWSSRPSTREQLFPGDGSFAPTTTDAWLLDALATGGPARLTSLARWQGVDKSTITLQVRRLLGAGLVERTPDPTDGRAALIGLTEEGRRVLDRVSIAGARLLAARLSGWSAADRAALTELLGRFADELGTGRPPRVQAS